jgi:general secretion pathway protein B
MSLILDALRKSEAERRRGQAPGLHTGMPLPPAPRASAWRHAPILAGGALVLVAVALLLARGQPSDDARGAVATTGVAPAARNEDALPDDGAEEVAPPPRVAPPVGAAGPPAPPPLAPPASSPVSAPTVAAVPRPAPVPVVAAPPAIPAVAAAAPTPPPVAGPAIAVAAPAAPAEDPLPTLAILPPGERATLPALKLSMHVWNESPARRFAIVDGQRIVEGAQLGSAVVTQIRRDGVELDVNGRRVLLPRP